MNNLWVNLSPLAKKILILFVLSLSIIGALSLSERVISSLSEKGFPQAEQTQPEAPQLVYAEVKFIILSKTSNEPVEGAEVQFIFDGAPEPRLTNSDGYVSINIPKRDDIDVIIKRKGFKDLTRRINLKADPQRTITYYLDHDEKNLFYNLYNNYKKGDLIKKSSILTINRTIISQAQSTSTTKNNQDIGIELKSTESTQNQSVDLKILETVNSRPVKFIEETTSDFTIIKPHISVEFRDKNYNYKYSISENGTFNNTAVLYANKKGVWSRHLIEQIPNDEQEKELIRKWEWEDIYPQATVKVGQSWDMTRFSGLFIGNAAITKGSIQGELKEVTEYEGEAAARILVKGNITFEVNSESSPKYEKGTATTNKILQLFLPDLSKDLVSDVIAGNIYNDNYEINESLKDSNNALYNKLISIYNEIKEENDVYSLNLSQIREKVLDKIEKYEVNKDFLRSFSQEQMEDLQEQVISKKITLSLNGEIYRSLLSPVDLYAEIKLSGTSEALDGNTEKIEGNMIEKSYIAR